MAADYLEFGIGLSEAITLDLVYGRTTAVDENNVRTFADNTSGTATATGSGDAPRI
jgi:hypothetical protein